MRRLTEQIRVDSAMTCHRVQVSYFSWSFILHPYPHPNYTGPYFLFCFVFLGGFFVAVLKSIVDASRWFVSMPKGGFWLKLWCNCYCNWPHAGKPRILSHKSICSFCAPGCCFQAWLDVQLALRMQMKYPSALVSSPPKKSSSTATAVHNALGLL